MCGGSCFDTIDICASQESCFTCPGEVFDLDSMNCIPECPEGKVLLEGDMYGSFSYCRGLEIYVDSSSTSLVELGTIDYPYKQIGLAFREVFESWKTLDLNLTIYVKSGTINEFIAGEAIFFSMGKVEIITYGGDAKAAFYIL